jgi:hypothetical protein
MSAFAGFTYLLGGPQRVQQFAHLEYPRYDPGSRWRRGDVGQRFLLKVLAEMIALQYFLPTKQNAYSAAINDPKGAVNG